MFIAQLIVLALLLLTPPVKYGFNRAYISPYNTLPVKGFWVLAVFFSHFSGYVALTGALNSAFLWVNRQIGQLCVVMFFFYSGYGIWISYQSKEDYLKTFVRHRFLPVWLSFAICILLFAAENRLLGIEYPLRDFLLSFTGWTSIGNSNWVMFVTFALYAAFFLCFKILRKSGKGPLGLTVYTAICFAMVAVLYFKKESWWYDTLLCFPAGMWYAALKNKIDGFAFRKNKNYVLLLAASAALLIGAYLLQKWHTIFFLMFAVQFCLVTAVITMKFTFRSVPLAFFGKHVFSIYILQRLVFHLGRYYGLHQYPYLFFAVCLVGTVLLAVGYDFVFDKCKRGLARRSGVAVKND